MGSDSLCPTLRIKLVTQCSQKAAEQIVEFNPVIRRKHLKIIKKNWLKFALGVSAGFILITLFASGLLWGQTAPGLGIAITPTNQVSLTVINGASNGMYQIYFTEFLDPANANWILLTNGTTGQTNFSTPMGDLEQGFFKAVNNPSFLPPSITVIIQSPANGSVVQ